MFANRTTYEKPAKKIFEIPRAFPGILARFSRRFSIKISGTAAPVGCAKRTSSRTVNGAFSAMQSLKTQLAFSLKHLNMRSAPYTLRRLPTTSRQTNYGNPLPLPATPKAAESLAFPKFAQSLAHPRNGPQSSLRPSYFVLHTSYPPLASLYSRQPSRLSRDQPGAAPCRPAA
jgi:hypothetical protein